MREIFSKRKQDVVQILEVGHKQEICLLRKEYLDVSLQKLLQYKVDLEGSFGMRNSKKQVLETDRRFLNHTITSKHQHLQLAQISNFIQYKQSTFI
ncbi:unnamed protein product [Paramecium pentaurelia]|uniref:Uncharacterized protein n=1 Tax=Paramecium pentaurelia TaxID=43138 RepID=A0A8S1YH11_9CILI|nr:unnamed protein product [Paramecium pentaurelia]